MRRSSPFTRPIPWQPSATRQRQNSHRQQMKCRRLRLESLEARQLLTVASGSDAAVVQQSLAADVSTAQVEAAAASQANSETGVVATTEENATAAVQRFDSAEEFTQFLVAAAIERFSDLFGQPAYPRLTYDYFGSILLGAPATTVKSAAAFTGAANDGQIDFSETNVQVAGVDEGDIVETDGEFLYIASRNTLTIIDARKPDELKIASRVEFEQSPTDMFLHEDRLTLIFPDQNKYYYTPSYGAVATTHVVIVDVADAEAPQVVARTELQGSFVEARAIGQFVYLVSRSTMTLPQPISYCSPGGCFYETQDEYVDRVQDRIADLMIPEITSSNDDGLTVTDKIDPTAIYKTESSGFSQLLAFTTFDMLSDTSGPVSTAAVPETTAATIYASTNSLYLIGQSQWATEESTSVTKFDFAADGSVEMVARGQVTGHVLNQFSVDEHEGLLRIATTTGSRESWRNHLFVLEQQGQALEVVGKIEDLAPGEKIYSVRFMGDRAYVVTFVKVDPLFAIDLSDPTNPQVLGELKVSGFSDYLQPIGENYLIGIGRNADEVAPGATWTWYRELQISLFDVSDLSNPILVDRYSFEGGRGTNSDARFEHHAVSYFSEFNTLVIPVQVADDTGFGGYGGQSEFRVFKIDVESGIEVLGSIQFDATPQRSLRIEDLLFTISTNEVKVHELQNPDVKVGALQYGDGVDVPQFPGGIVRVLPPIIPLPVVQPIVIVPPIPDPVDLPFVQSSEPLPVADEASLGIDADVRGEIRFDEASGRVTVYGTDAADVATVRSRGDRIVVRLNFGDETKQEVFTRSEVNDIVFAGWDGDDLFRNHSDVVSYAFGHAGNDRLIGGSAADQLFGGDGDDRLSGNEGHDRIHGGDGDDRATGGAGNDIVRGENGDDRVNGSDGDDNIDGGAGDDWLAGQDGQDDLQGGNGNDRLLGGNDDDTIDGGAGDDTLRGGAGNDFLSGGEDTDTVRGDSGNDIINGQGDRVFGGAGNDRIVGGLGGTIHGGAGNDRIQFTRDVVVFGGDGDDIIKSCGTTDVWLDAQGMFQHSDEKTKDDGENRIAAGAGDDVVRTFGDNDTVDEGEGEGDDQVIRRFL